MRARAAGTVTYSGRPPRGLPTHTSPGSHQRSRWQEGRTLGVARSSQVGTLDACTVELARRTIGGAVLHATLEPRPLRFRRGRVFRHLARQVRVFLHDLVRVLSVQSRRDDRIEHEELHRDLGVGLLVREALVEPVVPVLLEPGSR